MIRKPPANGGDMASRNLRIIYIVGCGRSGSTLLSRLLEHEGFRAIGETRLVADKMSAALPCGCGVVHAECPVWAPVLASMRATETRSDWHLALHGRRNQILHLMSRHCSTPRQRRALETVRDIYSRLGSDGTPLVDESKTPWLGYLLATQSWADVRFVEIVRSPLDVINSWSRDKDWINGKSREASARLWLDRCLTSEAARLRSNKPWLRRSFVHLVNEPDVCLSEILGREQTVLRRDGERWQFDSPTTHIFRSNPDKLRRGLDSIRPVTAGDCEPSFDAGPWERLAVRYWNTSLSRRVTLSQQWQPWN